MTAAVDTVLGVAYGLIVGAFLLTGILLSRLRLARPAVEIEAEALLRVRTEALAKSALLRGIDPLVRILTPIVRRLGFESMRTRGSALLAQAGNPYGYDGTAFVAFQLACALLAGGGLFLVFLLQGEVAIVMPLLLGALTYWLTYMNLRSRAQQRLIRLDRQVPYFLDLVTLTMGAGATFLQACETLTSGPLRGPLEEEIEAMLREVRAGKSPSDALANVSRRTGSEEMRGLVLAVRQGQELGTPLVEIFEHQASMNRYRRTQHGEQTAAKLPNRMALPNTILMLSILLLLFGPIIVKAARGELL